MKVERKEIGPRMSQIVVHGDTVYLAGVVAREKGADSVTEQTREILASIDKYLASVGSDKSKLLSANIWLADMSTFNVWRSCSRRSSPESSLASSPPSRACGGSRIEQS